MTEAQTAWVAGVIEGEGCFTIADRKTHPRPRITVAMTDLDVLQRLVEYTGKGSVIGPINRAKYANKKPIWYWHVQRKEECVELINELLPWLCERRSIRARELLAVAAAMPGRGEDKTHCKRGHPFDEENTYMHSGRRHCRACRTQAVADHRRKAVTS